MTRSAILLLVASVALGACAGRGHVDDVDDFSADEVFNSLEGGGPRLERVAFTTEIDTITFTPAAPTSRSFPTFTDRLYFCFLLRGVEQEGTLEVTWNRVDEDEPLSVTRQQVDSDTRLAAEHVAERPFRPGPHFVRVTLDDEEIARVQFEIEGQQGPVPEALAATKVTNLGFYAAQDRRGRPRGRPLNRFRSGTQQVHCAFRVHDAPPETEVGVQWYQGGRLVATTSVGTVEGTRSLSASVDNDAPLPDGEYRVQVNLEGFTKTSGAFVIGSGASPEAAGGPAFSHLQLSTAVHRTTRRPTAPVTTTFDGSEEEIFLSMRYRGLANNQSVEIHWFQGVHSEQPMAVSTIHASGSGQMAASFAPNGPMPPGEYRADVVIGDEVLESIPFTVEP